jgi:hypothetical protein
MVKYADDIVTLLPIYKTSNIHALVKREIEHLNSWANSNGLQLNEDKTKLMFVKCSDKAPDIQTSNQLSILGVTYQPYLRWEFETERRCKKASQRLYVLRKLKSHVPKYLLFLIHNNFILSVLEYANPIFLSLSEKDSAKLERIQRRSHKIVCGAFCDCDSFPLLSERRTCQALKCFIALMKEHHILHHLLPKRLPSGVRLSFPVCRTTRRLKSFIPSCTALFNNQ